MATGVELIAAERKRQVEQEGWTPQHDAEHSKGELLAAARCYVEAARGIAAAVQWATVDGPAWAKRYKDGAEEAYITGSLAETADDPLGYWMGRTADGSVKVPDSIVSGSWPWEASWWKPSDDPIRNLVKAGALIAAEIDRLASVRAASTDTEGEE